MIFPKLRIAFLASAVFLLLFSNANANCTDEERAKMLMEEDLSTEEVDKRCKSSTLRTEDTDRSHESRNEEEEEEAAAAEKKAAAEAAARKAAAEAAAKKAAAAASKNTAADEEDELWRRVRKSGAIKGFEEYLSIYPNGRYSMDAESEISRIRMQRQRTKATETTSADVVVDRLTLLMWQKGEPGEMAWKKALSYCNNLSLVGNSFWRLPEIKELQTSYNIKDRFPNFPKSGFFKSKKYYWSATKSKQWKDYAWGMAAADGSLFEDGHFESEYNVRCVRSMK